MTTPHDVQPVRPKTAQSAPPTPDRLITWTALHSMFPVSRMSIWRMMRDGQFPLPIRQGRRNYWLISEVAAWLESRTSARKAPTSRAGDAKRDAAR